MASGHSSPNWVLKYLSKKKKKNQIATQILSSVKASYLTSLLLPLTTPISPFWALTPASRTKHRDHSALLLAAIPPRSGESEAGPPSQGRHNAEGHSSPGEHANHKWAGTPGLRRAPDPVQHRVAQSSLPKGGRPGGPARGGDRSRHLVTA